MLLSLSKLDEDEKLEISKQIQAHLFETELWKSARVVGIYLSMGDEWDTREIVLKAFEEGKNIVIPKTIPETKELAFYQITDTK